MPTPSYDVLVVGAGLAGCHLARRLSFQHPKRRIALLERSACVGGRLLSPKKDGSGSPAELGAMRYVPSAHRRVAALVEQLHHLKRNPMVLSGEDELLLLGGKAVRRSSLGPDVAPDALVARAFLEAQELRGRATCDVMLESLGPEACDYVTKACGCGLTTLGRTNASVAAVEFLRTEMAEKQQSAVFFPDGIQRLPEALAEDFVASGGELRLLTPVHRVTEAEGAGGGFLVTLGDGSVLSASTVVLAVPPRTAEAVLAGLRSRSAFTLLAGAVVAIPATKVILSYPSAWWEEFGLFSPGILGHVVTDLPCHQCVFFPPTAMGPGPALALAAYVDRPLKELLGEDADAPAPEGTWESYRASPRILRWAAEQMALLASSCVAEEKRASAVAAALAPSEALLKEWDEAWHAWRPETWDPAAAAAAAIQPVPNLPLFVCGEAFSSNQGWMEGALETADEVFESLLEAKAEASRTERPT